MRCKKHSRNRRQPAEAVTPGSELAGGMPLMYGGAIAGRWTTTRVLRSTPTSVRASDELHIDAVLGSFQTRPHNFLRLLTASARSSAGSSRSLSTGKPLFDAMRPAPYVVLHRRRTMVDQRRVSGNYERSGFLTRISDALIEIAVARMTAPDHRVHDIVWPAIAALPSKSARGCHRVLQPRRALVGHRSGAAGESATTASSGGAVQWGVRPSICWRRIPKACTEHSGGREYGSADPSDLWRQLWAVGCAKRKYDSNNLSPRTPTFRLRRKQFERGCVQQPSWRNRR